MMMMMITATVRETVLCCTSLAQGNVALAIANYRWHCVNMSSNTHLHYGWRKPRFWEEFFKGFSISFRFLRLFSF